GQTKCLRFGSGVHFVKNNLLPVPPIFEAIQKASNTSAEEMFRVYNMGHRMEIYCEPAAVPEIIALSESHGIPAREIGHTETSTEADARNHLSITHNGETHTYTVEA
ncbi:MAG: AIR synthase-related protein, partial [Opitutales bacterium]